MQIVPCFVNRIHRVSNRLLFEVFRSTLEINIASRNMHNTHVRVNQRRGVRTVYRS